MSECARYQPELGAYVLGGLDTEDARAVAAHLERCEDCRAEHTDIAAAPALLELAREAPPRAPARVRDRVVAEATRRQGRRRWLAATAAASVLAALLGGVAGWRLGPGPVPAVTVALQSADPFEASGQVTFAPAGQEVEVAVELEGLEPLARPAVYEAWVSTREGRVLSIGQFDTTAGPHTARFTADGPLDTYRGFWITAEPDARDPAHDGPTVLRAPVPHLR